MSTHIRTTRLWNTPIPQRTTTRKVINSLWLVVAFGLLVLAGSVAPAQAWLEPLPRVFAAQLLGLQG